MTHLVNGKQALMENVSFQDLTPLSMLDPLSIIFYYFISFLVKTILSVIPGKFSVEQSLQFFVHLRMRTNHGKY